MTTVVDATKTASESIRHDVVLRDLHESPFNRRRAWGNLDELAASFKELGVLQPLLARIVKGKFELVFGHRRFRAAKLAALTHVPVNVREMTDEQVIEAQAIENLQRADVHPIDEAETYEQLLKIGRTAEDVAVRVGKSKAYVYGRLKLLALCPEARTAFFDDQLTASTALYVARIPSPKLQLEALKAISSRDRFHDEPMSARQAAEEIRERFMLKLVDARFDITDPDLVPSAGSCSACPKRTGNQAELFADVDSADVCTDTDCFRSKLDAEWARRVTRAKETVDARVLSAAETKKALFPYGTHSMSSHGGLVDLDSKCYADPKTRTYRKLLKGEPLPLVLARNPDTGAILELVDEKKAKAAFLKIGHKFAQPQVHEPGARPGASAEDKAARAKDAFERRVDVKRAEMAVEAIVKAAEKRVPSPAFWGALAKRLTEDAYGGSTRALERRGLVGEEQLNGAGVDDHTLLEELMSGMTEAQLRGLVVELAIGDEAEFVGLGGSFKAWCELYKVDPKSYAKGARQAVKLENTAATAAAAVAKVAKKAKKA